VGSHVLDYLRAQDIAASVLLRPTSDRTFLEPHLPQVDIRVGAVTEPETLPTALQGITHVIHCAGCIKARRQEEFYLVNQAGTRNLVDAINRSPVPIQRLVHVSSLAAFGPATPAQPAREDAAPKPVSIYGKSKWLGELEVRGHCRVPYTVLRPPAVYGPRDTGFLPLFRAANFHVRPMPDVRQALSIIFVTDLAKAIVACLTHPAVVGKTFFASSREIVTGRRLASAVATLMGRWTIPLPLPTPALWPVCLVQEAISRLTGKASVLSLQKFAELRAPGWVCDPSLLEQQVDFRAATGLQEGLAETLHWYQEHHWL
jgi:nucleoside-diphosphate-sugar epimerase